MPARLAVHVTPKAGRDEIAGWRDGELQVRVTDRSRGRQGERRRVRAAREGRSASRSRACAWCAARRRGTSCSRSRRSTTRRCCGLRRLGRLTAPAAVTRRGAAGTLVLSVTQGGAPRCAETRRRRAGAASADVLQAGGARSGAATARRRSPRRSRTTRCSRSRRMLVLATALAALRVRALGRRRRCSRWSSQVAGPAHRARCCGRSSSPRREPRAGAHRVRRRHRDAHRRARRARSRRCSRRSTRSGRCEPKSGPRGPRASCATGCPTFLLLLAVGVLLVLSLAASARAHRSRARRAALRRVSAACWRRPRTSSLFVVVGTVLFSLVFKVLPDARIALRDVWVGALVTAVLFALGQLLIGLYLSVVERRLGVRRGGLARRACSCGCTTPA